MKDHIFPKLGIVESRDIEKIISDLNYGAKKMREGSKSLNVVQLGWESNEDQPTTNEKSPARKVTQKQETPKKTSATTAKSTPTPLKSALKPNNTSKNVAPQYPEEEDYASDYMDEEDA